MYTKNYPVLETLGANEDLLRTADERFSDLFNLPVLEQEAKKSEDQRSPYFHFFTCILRKLAEKKLYTEEEIASGIPYLLNYDEQVRAYFHEQLLFIPSTSDKPSPQLGFHEGVIKKTITSIPALSYIDMLRAVNYLTDLRLEKSKKMWIDNDEAEQKIAVVNIADLQRSEVSLWKKDKQPLVVNFNCNPRGPAKWGIVEPCSQYYARIYCESPLSEKETGMLKEKLAFSECNYDSPPKSENLLSTGYNALQSLDSRFVHAGQINTIRLDDSPTMLKKFIHLLFKGLDENSLKFKCAKNDFPDDAPEWMLKMGQKGAWCLNDDFKNILATLFFHPQNPYHRDVSSEELKACARYSMSDMYSVALQFGLIAAGNAAFELMKFKPYEPGMVKKFQELVQKQRGDYLAPIFGQDDKDANEEEQYKVLMRTLIVNWLRKSRTLEEIEIHIPENLTFSPKEQVFLVNTLQNNSSLKKISLIGDKSSLGDLEARLNRVSARNTFLKANGYLPPLVDDCWRRVAQYWVAYIAQNPDLLREAKDFAKFKNCVKGMGSTGLDAVLNLLCDSSQANWFSQLLAKKSTAFYLACEFDDVNDCINRFIKHLEQGDYFPFSELGVFWQPKHEADYLRLIDVVNQSSELRQIKLSNCKENLDDFPDFLRSLIKRAIEKEWTIPMAIPAFADEKLITEEYRSILALYTQLNNIIGQNRQKKSNKELLSNLKAIRNSVAKDDNSPAQKTVATNPIKTQAPAKKAVGSWPLKRGTVGLQMQHQQQQQQQVMQQFQNQHQQKLEQAEDMLLPDKLVSFENIASMLRKEFTKLKRANEIQIDLPQYYYDADIKPYLQGLFQTWISADPKAKAANIIRYMTPDAAKMLLRNRERYPNGLVLEDLDQGFFTQRNSEGHLVLCYKIERGYVSTPTPLTITTVINKPKAGAWEGDFRLLKNNNNSGKWEESDRKYLLLFARFQPEPVYELRDLHAEWDLFLENLGDNYEKEAISYEDYYARMVGEIPDFKRFLAKNPDIAKQITSQGLTLTRIQRSALIQAWKYAGSEGAKNFLQGSLELSVEEAFPLLLAGQEESLKNWAIHHFSNEAALKALGQVYYNYGEEGLGLLLNQFHSLNVQMGDDFFNVFKKLNDKTENYSCFFNAGFFKASSIMMTECANNPLLKETWLTAFRIHVESVSWENVDTLWNGFHHFVTQINNMGLPLTKNIFAGLQAPQNMMASMSRILSSLAALPRQEDQQFFLAQLSTFDLTEGGVHYAIKEGFKYLGEELKLKNFEEGQPTYLPKLDSAQKSALQMGRALASISGFSQEESKSLIQKLNENPEQGTNPDYLVLLLCTTGIKPLQLWDAISQLDSKTREMLAAALHHLVFIQGASHVKLDYQLLEQIAKEMVQSPAKLDEFKQLLAKDLKGELFATLSILLNTKNWKQFEPLFTILKKSDASLSPYCKMATFFGQFDSKQIRILNEQAEASTIKKALQSVEFLNNQLLSINYPTSEVENLPKYWNDYLNCIKNIHENPLNAEKNIETFIKQLEDDGIKLKYKIEGSFRTLLDEDKKRHQNELHFFLNHEQRLWQFLERHLVIPQTDKEAESLKPVLRLFRKVLSSSTFINELEPFLAALETTQEKHYWPVNYFVSMVNSLEIKGENGTFPIEMLAALVKSPRCQARSLKQLELAFPEEIKNLLQIILKNTAFNPKQKTRLCQLTLLADQVGLITKIMNSLSLDSRLDMREGILESLLKNKTSAELQEHWGKINHLLKSKIPLELSAAWPQTAVLWAKTLRSTKGNGCFLFDKIQRQAISKEDKAYLLHLIAWSTLQATPSEQAETLINQLATLKASELEELAACYPGTPSPNTENLLKIVSGDIKKGIEAFQRCPYPKPKDDYAGLTRPADLHRMFEELTIASGNSTTSLSAEQIGQIVQTFSQLKDIEAGKTKLSFAKTFLNQLSKQDLQDSFKRICSRLKTDPKNTGLLAEKWALAFENLARTTNKYPNMAQQLAFISNDFCMTEKSQISTVQTGEGKSPIITTKALIAAGMGKKVIVVTSKESLVGRDQEEYKAVFDYMGFSSAALNSHSAPQTYTDNQILRCTLSELSLFLDNSALNGNYIEIEPNTVVLFDEVDFIRYYLQTAFNCARFTGKTPKEMMWFYRAANTFYETHMQGKLIKSIEGELLDAFNNHLYKAAGSNEDRIHFLDEWIRDQFDEQACWLQSAHEVRTLKRKTHFAVIEQDTKIGNASYRMQKIVPLDEKQNQKMLGSSYALGTDQLLADYLIWQAEKENKEQNFHVLPESRIASSQVADAVIRKLFDKCEKVEGYTGTMSELQVKMLQQKEGAQVLKVPTNKKDLRVWHKPQFFETEHQRHEAVKNQIEDCLSNQKSILFAAKNDEAVGKLETVLSDFKDELLPYDNEDKRDVAKILKKKRKMEHWQGARKNSGVCLLASGFGRGDNVDVETVILFDVNDTNDLLQKGGRTARIGNAGEVYQFYLVPELKAEYRRLLEILSEKLKQFPEFKSDPTDNEELFKRVMLLREYNAYLQNETDQTYRVAVSEFSEWSMELVGRVDNYEDRNRLITKLEIFHNSFDKEWARLADQDSAKKIEAIKTIIAKAADQFLTEGKNFLIEKPFTYKAIIPMNLDLSLRKKENTKSENLIRLLAAIGTKLASLSWTENQQLPALLKVIDNKPLILESFKNRIENNRDSRQVYTALQIAAEHIESAGQDVQIDLWLTLSLSKLWMATESNIQNPKRKKALLAFLSDLSFEKQKEWKEFQFLLDLSDDSFDKVMQWPEMPYEDLKFLVDIALKYEVRDINLLLNLAATYPADYKQFLSHLGSQKLARKILLAIEDNMTAPMFAFYSKILLEKEEKEVLALHELIEESPKVIRPEALALLLDNSPLPLRIKKFYAWQTLLYKEEENSSFFTTLEKEGFFSLDLAIIKQLSEQDLQPIKYCYSLKLKLRKPVLEHYLTLELADCIMLASLMKLVTFPELWPTLTALEKTYHLSWSDIQHLIQVVAGGRVDRVRKLVVLLSPEKGYPRALFSALMQANPSDIEFENFLSNYQLLKALKPEDLAYSLKHYQKYIPLGQQWLSWYLQLPLSDKRQFDKITANCSNLKSSCSTVKKLHKMGLEWSLIDHFMKNAADDKQGYLSKFLELRLILSKNAYSKPFFEIFKEAKLLQLNYKNLSRFYELSKEVKLEELRDIGKNYQRYFSLGEDKASWYLKQSKEIRQAVDSLAQKYQPSDFNKLPDLFKTQSLEVLKSLLEVEKTVEDRFFLYFPGWVKNLGLKDHYTVLALSVSPQSLHQFWALLFSNKALFENHPILWELASLSKTMTSSRFILTTELLLTILQNKQECPSLSYLNNLDERGIQNLTQLLKQHPDHSDQLLLDSKLVNEVCIFTVVKRFYEATAKTEDVREIANNLKDLFDFTNKNSHESRLILMYLLQKQTFITRNQRWSREQNQALLEQAYQMYATRGQTVLGGQLVVNLSEQQPFKSEQFSHLSRVSSEVCTLNEVNRVKRVSQTNKEVECKRELGRLMDSYASLSKSGDREKQLAALKNSINGQNTYEQLITCIDQARDQSIASDYQANKSCYFFKVNRKGYSTFLNMLHEMEKSVVRIWLQDGLALQEFSQHQKQTLVHRQSLINQVVTALHDHNQEINASLEGCFGFFKSREYRNMAQDLNKLEQGLRQFKTTNQKTVLEQINTNLAKLPGELQTLLKELQINLNYYTEERPTNCVIPQ